MNIKHGNPTSDAEKNITINGVSMDETTIYDLIFRVLWKKSLLITEAAQHDEAANLVTAWLNELGRGDPPYVPHPANLLATDASENEIRDSVREHS